MKLPPFGKPLSERLKYGNPPLYATVCIGLNSWSRAKIWNQSPADTQAMVLPPDVNPESLRWPVQHLPVVIDADTGPSLDQIADLALVLLQNGSIAVTLVSFTNSHPFTRYQWGQS